MGGERVSSGYHVWELYYVKRMNMADNRVRMRAVIHKRKKKAYHEVCRKSSVFDGNRSVGSFSID